MRIPRRELLQSLPFAFAPALLSARSRPPVPDQAPSASPAPNSPKTPSAPTPAEKVTGIGGFFFRANDPKTLSQWYLDHLGVSLIPTSTHDQPWQQEAGPTAFAPFPQSTKYFGDPQKNWMINFRVRNLDRMAAQLQAAGVSVKLDPQSYPNGRFARLHDPEGNPIELWEPNS